MAGGATTGTSKETKAQWAKIIARTWVDDDFKQKLISDPIAVAEEYGIEDIGDTPVEQMRGKVKIDENPDATPGEFHWFKKELTIYVPPRPSGDQTLSDAQLTGAVGGVSIQPPPVVSELIEYPAHTKHGKKSSSIGSTISSDPSGESKGSGGGSDPGDPDPDPPDPDPGCDGSDASCCSTCI